MSVELTFCMVGGCYSKLISYNEYIARLPIKYDSLRKAANYTNGFVFYDESVINDLWTLLFDSLFMPYKCLKLEIAIEDLGVLDGIFAGTDGWV